MKIRSCRWVFLAQCFLACTSAEEVEPRFTVRDSAGISVVENQRPLFSGDQTWRLSTPPLIEIGGVGAEGQAALFRVSDGLRLSDSTIVAANAGTHELRFFDSRGRPRRAVGRYGGGPGEFQDMYHIARVGGDSVLVFDGILARATTFTGRGDLARVETFEAPGAGYLFFRGRLDDGRLLAYRGWTSASDTFPLRTGRYPTRRMLLLLRDGRADTVGAVPGSERFVLIRGDRRTYTSAPFPHTRFELATGAAILLGQNDEYELRRITPDGEVVQIVRRAASIVPVTSEHVAAFRARRLQADDSPSTRRTVESIIEQADLPEYLPLISGLLGDAEGNVWVQAYDEPTDTVSTWSVFSRDGQWITDVVVPAGGRVLDIGSDYLLGVWRDELDVELLKLYDLHKPDRGLAP